MPNELPVNILADFVINHTQRILVSYRKWTGKNLLESSSTQPPSSVTLAQQLFHSPFVVVTSNAAEDPILNYGNQAGLNLWEMPWEVLTRTPGRKTAEPMHRGERQKFLDEVQKNGFIDNYSGIRISNTGKRFKIEKATVWNLLDESGQYLGQAATFTQWKYL